MEHIAAVLLIVGCSPNLSDCHELPAPVPIFETFEECQTILPASLERFKSAGPQIMGTCVSVDPAAEEEGAELVWDVSRDGKLRAEVVADAVVARDESEETSAF